MKHIKSIVAITGLFITFCSCNKERYYDSGVRVYFTKDSTYYSFGDKSANITSTIIRLPVRIMGTPESTERSFAVKVQSKKTTAVTPLNFKAPSEVKVPADSVRSFVSLTLYRGNIKENDTLHVTLMVTTNDFTPGTKEFLETTVSFDNTLNKPDWWSWYTNYLGDYHRKKYQKFIDIHGDIVDKNYTAYNRYAFLRVWKKVKEYFEKHPEPGITFPNIRWPV